jgi:hypothetical protein
VTAIARPGDAAPDLFRRPVAHLIADLQAGVLSARGLTEHFLARIARLNPTLNAFTFVDPDAGAKADACDARLRAGHALGPLDGIPVAIKSRRDQGQFVGGTHARDLGFAAFPGSYRARR